MGKIYGDRWEIVESLGEGGQAQTFLVTDLRGQGETRYVLKRLKNLNRVERFGREIEAVRNLSHLNIVRLIDFDLGTEKPYLVTEYCSGGSLAKVEPFWQGSPQKALEIFQQVCRGVAYAHSQGITHRDLKPDNIFLQSKDGPAVVGDFGICYLEEGGTRVTLTEEAVGPVYYMAPELEDGRVVDISPKSDTYSLGKLLYWLLSGGRIFSREKHREQEWDLKGWNSASGQWKNIYMEHVNRLLDLMIISSPEKRSTVDQVLPEVEDVIRLVQKEFIPIAKDILAPCLFCGRGHYRLKAANNIDVHNFGFTPVGAPDWRILVCDTCGHVQAFRVDMADKKEWWSR